VNSTVIPGVLKTDPFQISVTVLSVL